MLSVLITKKIRLKHIQTPMHTHRKRERECTHKNESLSSGLTLVIFLSLCYASKTSSSVYLFNDLWVNSFYILCSFSICPQSKKERGWPDT